MLNYLKPVVINTLVVGLKMWTHLLLFGGNTYPKLRKSNLLTAGISFNRLGAVGKAYVSDKSNFANLYGWVDM